MNTNEQNSAEFYDEAWRRWGDMIRYSPGPKIRRERILSFLARESPSSILDVGCGNGEFLLMASQTFKGVRLAGCDVSPAILDQNRVLMPEAEFHTLDLSEESLGKRYDAVVCMEVVEHCRDHRAAIRHLAEMTKGRLAITVPGGPVFAIDKMVGHTHHFSTSEIRSALEAADLVVERIEAWGFPFFNLYKHAINVNPKAMTGAFLSDKPYGFIQKAVSMLVYGCFRLNLPILGYQIFAFARRPE